MEQSMVSVVITTCKRDPEIVNRAIASVIQQTYTNWELLVVDDSPASYDKRQQVQEAVAAWRDVRIKYLAHAGNQGACVARNTGLEHAAGEYIAYLDDDDEWLPQKLEKQVKQLQQSGGDTVLVYCGFLVRDDVIGRTRTSVVARNVGWVYPELIMDNFIGSTSFPLIRTAALRKIGGFDPLMQSAQDYDVWLRLAQDNQIAVVPEALVCYHKHGGEQITSNPAKKIAGLERINEKNIAYLNAHSVAFHIRTMKLALWYARGGRRADAWKAFRYAVRRRPLAVSLNIKYMYRLLRTQGETDARQ